MTLYTSTFYNFHLQGMIESADETVPLLIDLVHPTSVVDVGCGVGAWLRAFQQRGVSRCLGIDGSYVDRGMLLIPERDFQPHDLQVPIQVQETFDLAVCLEVAEHLPASAADTLVDSLIGLAPVVAFSAAIPFQGGDGHINEQWADYWVERFLKRGWLVVDCLRHRLWDNPRVKPYYAQNLLLMARDPERFKGVETGPGPLNVVHPQTYIRVVTWFQQQATSPAIPTVPNPLGFDRRSLNALYAAGDWDGLSVQLLSVLQHFEQQTYLQMDGPTQQATDDFVKQLLYFLSQPDYVVSNRFVDRFLQLNPVISNVVAMSSFETTDAYVRLVGSQSDNLVRLLILYSARNTVPIERKAIFAANPEVASAWYSRFFGVYRSALAEAHAQRHLQSHLASWDGIVNAVHDPLAVYLGATAVDPDSGRKLVGHCLQPLSNAVVRNKPRPRRVAIVCAGWHPDTNAYRTHYRMIRALRPDYDLTLVHLGPTAPSGDLGIFTDVRTVRFANGSLDLGPLQDNDFSIAYHVDVGSTIESLLLACVRLAPRTIANAAVGTCIDTVFDAAGPLESSSVPGHQVRADRCIVNCNWPSHQVTSDRLAMLAELLEQSQTDILYRFFCGGGLAVQNHYLPFLKTLRTALGAEHVEVVQHLPYSQYLERLQEGALALGSRGLDNRHSGCPTLDGASLDRAVSAIRDRSCGGLLAPVPEDVNALKRTLDA